ncbi:MAG TPA: hypothetical protein VGI70_20345 [Polyangiales bacterium]|jgi:alkylation response protein AidB-like acyl-CoA dehydrogenase
MTSLFAVSAPEGSNAREICAELECLSLQDAKQVAVALAHLERQRRLDLPHPGRGRSAERFDVLSEIAAVDLSLARLVEGHVDAHAILDELGANPGLGTYGVWAAEPPDAAVYASVCRGGHRLNGRKRYASGASSLTRALVTARTDEGSCLFDVELATPGVRAIEGSWPAVGMAHSDSVDVQFDDVFVPSSARIGEPGSYLSRPGFWHGAVGVAACWFGGALGCLRMLRKHFARVSCNEHAAAHVGAVAATCHAMQSVLLEAADAIDRDPQDKQRSAHERALIVRAVVERGCDEVLSHAGRAAGSFALVFSSEHARRAADLPVYVRQHHAEWDLAQLGRAVLEGPSWA